MQSLRGAKKSPAPSYNPIPLNSAASHILLRTARQAVNINRMYRAKESPHRKRPGGAAIYQAPFYRQAPHFNPRSPRGKQPQRQNSDLMRAAQANVDKLMDYYDNISEESGVRQECGRMAVTGFAATKEDINLTFIKNDAR